MNNLTLWHEKREDKQLHGRPIMEDPSDDPTSEEDPLEEKPSEIQPAEPDSPASDTEDTGTLPTGRRSYDMPEDDDGTGPRVRRRFAVRHWPPGCGRGPHADPVADALSREG